MLLRVHAGFDEREVKATLDACDARMQATIGETLAALADAGRLHAAAIAPTRGVPASFGEMLACALLVARRSGDTAQQAALANHYCVAMPRLRVQQMATSDAPNGILFHHPLDWEHLPRLSSLVERLFAWLDRAVGAAATAQVLGADTPSRFIAQRPTLAALFHLTHYGGFMPLLYGYPGDLAALGAELAAGATIEQTIDRWLAAPLAHELSHLGPQRVALQPPYLDECIAAYVGRRLLPETTWPAPGENNGLYGAPWLAQVGQALSRLVGDDALLAAHAGVVPWPELLPPSLLKALVQLGWRDHARQPTLHFLADTLRPERWLKLLFLGAAGRAIDEPLLDRLDRLPWSEIPPGLPDAVADRAILDDALRALCVRNFRSGLTYRVARAAPDQPITVDVERCRISRPPDRDGPDTAPLAYLLPPALAAQLRAQGIHEYTIELRDLAALDELAVAITRGDRARQGAGFSLRTTRQDAAT